jgi:hypothetical protein
MQRLDWPSSRATVPNSAEETVPIIEQNDNKSTLMTDQPIPPLPVPRPPDAALAPPLPRQRRPLLPERSDFLEGDEPAADKVEAFLAKALAATTSNPEGTAHALVPWICDALLSNHSIKAYGRDFLDFVQHMKAQGVDPLEVTADHVKLYKRALLEAGLQRTTVARRLSVLRGVYRQLAVKGLVSWDTASDIAAIQAPTGIQKNSTPSLTERQAIALLEAIPTDTLQGIRDLALISVYFITGCRASAIINTCVGHLETDGRALSERHRKAAQETPQDPARRRPPGAGLCEKSGYPERPGGAAVPATDQ